MCMSVYERVYVCMCMCMYVYVYTDGYVYVYMFSRVNACLCASVCVCMYIHTHARSLVYMSIHMRARGHDTMWHRLVPGPNIAIHGLPCVPILHIEIHALREDVGHDQ